LRKDKQEFIDSAIDGLTGSTFAMRNQLQQGMVKSTPEGIETLQVWQGTILDWNEKLDNLKTPLFESFREHSEPFEAVDRNRGALPCGKQVIRCLSRGSAPRESW
jgi:hypothetical protein